MKLSEAIDQFVGRELVLRGRAEDTRRGYSANLRQFSLHVMERHTSVPILENIDRQDVEDYLLHLKAKGQAATSIRRQASAIRGLFGWAEAHGLIDKNPAITVSLPRRAHKLLYVPSPGDVEMLLGQCVNPLALALIGVLYYCGLRVSEACQLELADVDFAEGVLVIRKGKGEKSRMVPMCRSVRAMLRQYVGNVRPDTESPYLFATPRSGGLSRNRAIALVREERDRVGISQRLTPHALRRAFGTHLYRQGVDLMKLRDLLGHANLATLHHYVQTAPEDLMEVVALLE